MGVKIIITVLIALVVVLSSALLFTLTFSCEAEQVQSAPKIFIVEESQDKTYIVEENDPLAWYEDTRDERLELNTIRYALESEDEQEEFDIRSRYSNVVRIIDGELFIGYDEELDDIRWKELE